MTIFFLKKKMVLSSIVIYMDILPNEMLIKIMYYLQYKDIIRICFISKKTIDLCNDYFWKIKTLYDGYIEDISYFGHIDMWLSGKANERYLQFMSKTDVT